MGRDGPSSANVLESVIDTVTVASTTLAANCFDPDRIAIHWRL